MALSFRFLTPMRPFRGRCAPPHVLRFEETHEPNLSSRGSLRGKAYDHRAHLIRALHAKTLMGALWMKLRNPRFARRRSC
jgi:hypothetical protein